MPLKRRAILPAREQWGAWGFETVTLDAAAPIIVKPFSASFQSVIAKRQQASAICVYDDTLLCDLPVEGREATTHKHECLTRPDPGPRIGRQLPPLPVPISVGRFESMAGQASLPR